MKLLVETIGDFMLMDGGAGQEIEAHRPCVVVSSNFVSMRMAVKQIKVLGELTDEATDAEFITFLNESGDDVELAVGSFLAKYAPEKVTEKKAKKA